MNSFGKNFRLSVFGESHGKAVGIVIDGIPAGTRIDFSRINDFLSRRSPIGFNEDGVSSTERAESDSYKIVSGITKGTANGSPMCVLFENEDAKRNENVLIRGGRAEFASYIKSKGYADLSGGGHFSARVTAGIVFAGAIACQLLAEKGIKVSSHILSIGNIVDDSYDFDSLETIFSDKRLPVINEAIKEPIKQLLSECKKKGDSVGGSVECAVINAPIGLGEPFFDSFEGVLSHMIFSIPAVCGIQFGSGFASCCQRGSEYLDELNSENAAMAIRKMGKLSENGYLFMDKKNKIAHTNSAGGIVGGLTNSMPIVFTTGFKPLSSIRISQESIDVSNDIKPVIAKSEGRNDITAVVRGSVIVESVACIVTWDFFAQT